MARVESGCLESLVHCHRVLYIAVEDDGLAAKRVLLVGVDSCVNVLGCFVGCCHLSLIEVSSLHLELGSVNNLSR